jgi:hypothetical protein
MTPSHTPAAQLFDDAVARNCLPDHWRESYVRARIKSMKAEGMAVIAADGWRNIPVTLKTPQCSEIAWLLWSNDVDQQGS